MIEVKVAELQDQTVWDEYVKAHPNATPYHLFAWGQAVQQAYAHRMYYLIALDSQKLVGVLPLIKFKKPLLGERLCSLPFCDLGGCLADNEEIQERLLNFAGAWLTKAKTQDIDYRAGRASKSVQSTESENLAGKKVRMLLPLPDTATELWDGFKSKLRSQIRKAGKNGLTAELNCSAQKPQKLMDGFYQVISRNMRDLGSPVHSKSWFENILKYYGENAVVALVYKGDKVAGAGIVLKCGNKACIPWASTVSEYNRLAPNMLLYWTLLEHVADADIQEFDFGRSTFNEGTYRFKAQWGAKPQLLEWCRLDANACPINEETQATSKGRLREKVENIWRKLPLSITEALGPRVRKYISL